MPPLHFTISYCKWNIVITMMKNKGNMQVCLQSYDQLMQYWQVNSSSTVNLFEQCIQIPTFCQYIMQHTTSIVQTSYSAAQLLAQKDSRFLWVQICYSLHVICFHISALHRQKQTGLLTKSKILQSPQGLDSIWRHNRMNWREVS